MDTTDPYRGDRTEVQREVALDIRKSLRATYPLSYHSDIYVSDDGEMSFQYEGRQIIVKVVAAR